MTLRKRCLVFTHELMWGWSPAVSCELPRGASSHVSNMLPSSGSLCSCFLLHRRHKVSWSITSSAARNFRLALISVLLAAFLASLKSKWWCVATAGCGVSGGSWKTEHMVGPEATASCWASGWGITEGLRWEGTSRGHLVQPPCSGGVPWSTLPRIVSRRLLAIYNITPQLPYRVRC